MVNAKYSLLTLNPKKKEPIKSKKESLTGNDPFIEMPHEDRVVVNPRRRIIPAPQVYNYVVPGQAMQTSTTWMPGGAFTPANTLRNTGPDLVLAEETQGIARMNRETT